MICKYLLKRNNLTNGEPGKTIDLAQSINLCCLLAEACSFVIMAFASEGCLNDKIDENERGYQGPDRLNVGVK